jgi:hypothetical protein
VGNVATIQGLLDKTAELQQAIAELSHEIYQRKWELTLLERTLQLFAPNVTRVRRQIATFVRSRYFRPGEITRRCQEALREDRGDPVTVEIIVWRATRDKGLDLADAPMHDDFGRRFSWSLNQFFARGLVRKQGTGVEAQWTLTERRIESDVLTDE